MNTTEDTNGSKNKEESGKTEGSTTVEVEVSESVTVKNSSTKTNKKGGVCCCCPATFNGTNRRSHVCYCPLYDMTRVLYSAATDKEEDCGCGTKYKCCAQPFINHMVTYSLCANDCGCSPRNLRE